MRRFSYKHRILGHLLFFKARECYCILLFALDYEFSVDPKGGAIEIAKLLMASEHRLFEKQGLVRLQSKNLGQSHQDLLKKQIIAKIKLTSFID